MTPSIKKRGNSMDDEEFKNWTDLMKSRRGIWSIDPIHDGVNRDLLAFIPDEKDHTQGVYVSASGSNVEVGTFIDAIPHIGEASFQKFGAFTIQPLVDDEGGMAKPSPEAMKLIYEKIGLPFILGTACDVPARSVRS